MEALVNIAYDRISEDIILLYDAMRAYNEVPSVYDQFDVFPCFRVFI